MTGYSLQMGEGPVIWAGVIQGCGLGFIFVPLSTVTFATLPSEYRTEAAGIYSLLRNVGSSLGISVVQTLLTENTQINHATIAEHITASTRCCSFRRSPSSGTFTRPPGWRRSTRKSPVRRR